MDRWTQAEVLLRELRGQGFRVRVDGERLLVTPVPGMVLTDEQRTEIVAVKPELLATLRHETFRAAMLAAVDDIAAAWVPDVEPSLVLVAVEAELDKAADQVEHSLGPALDALERWRGLWLERCRAERSFRERGQVHERGKIRG